MDFVQHSFCTALDKELTLQVLELNRIPAVRLVDIKNSPFPVIGRMHGHQQGSDIVVVTNADQAREEGFDYFTRMYVIESEYRVEVEGLTVTKIEEAFPEEVMWNEFPIRSASYGWVFREVDIESVSKEWLDLCVRALYITGLTHGVVKIGKLVSGAPIIIDINPTDKAYQAPAYVPSHSFTMGADVEFMMDYQGQMIPASRFFPNDGGVGCDERQIERDSGDYALVEMRPDASPSPKKLFENIRQLLVEASEKVPYRDIEFRSGSMPFSGYQCGGHLHFGLPISLQLLRVLDQYLALPVGMIEDSRTAKRRRRTKHGGLGRYRIKPYGFEYISLSSWIAEPEITLAILCLAKICANHYYELPADLLFQPLIQRAYYRGNRLCLRQIWPILKDRLVKTASYPHYEKELAPLFIRIEEGKLWQESSDMRDTWDLPRTDQAYDPGMVIHLSRKIRKQFTLTTGQTYFIRAGKNVTQATISSHPYAFRDPDAVQISKPLRDLLGIPEWWKPRIFTQDGAISLGPVIGVMANSPFGRQETYFHNLNKLGTEKNMLVYYFEPNDIDWHNMTIKGISHQGPGVFPFPDVIYDRYFLGPYRKNYNIDEVRLKLMTIYGVKFLNPPSLFELTGDKWRSHQLLAKDNADLLPETHMLQDPNDVIRMLDQYGEVFLKPIGGALGAGIIRVTRRNNGISWMESNAEDPILYRDSTEIYKHVRKLAEAGSYIVQEAIARKQWRGSTVEIRVYLQKNSKENLCRTGMVARLSKGGIVTILTDVNMKISQVLPKLYPDEADQKRIKERLAKASRRIFTTVEEQVGKIGELAIDLCIDQYDQIKIIEINSKPDNLFSSVKAFRLRNLANYRLLNYAAALAGHKPVENPETDPDDADSSFPSM
ncbi:putative amidoligase domain-containing protein [Brevibacillus dissolubilis]|uniref:putative amidoligase domain-containing protein n=1 Tax=Brevibacillus dissolubilis TaxID=1844116 RepID=UPI001117A206|nr:YheC/YheD family protein [Brevibacillus dissolubilis]